MDVSNHRRFWPIDIKSRLKAARGKAGDFIACESERSEIPGDNGTKSTHHIVYANLCVCAIKKHTHIYKYVYIYWR